MTPFNRRISKRSRSVSPNRLTFRQKDSIRNVLIRKVRKGVKSIYVVANWLSASALKMIKQVEIERGKLLLKIREGNRINDVSLTLKEVLAICS